MDEISDEVPRLSPTEIPSPEQERLLYKRFSGAVEKTILSARPRDLPLGEQTPDFNDLGEEEHAAFRRAVVGLSGENPHGSLTLNQLKLPINLLRAAMIGEFGGHQIVLSDQARKLTEGDLAEVYKALRRTEEELSQKIASLPSGQAWQAEGRLEDVREVLGNLIKDRDSSNPTVQQFAAENYK